MKKILKNKNGITLIALIITIIILVILAAVSINAIYNMGVVQYAVNGSQNYAKASVEENSIMNDSGNIIENTVEKIDTAINGKTELEAEVEARSVKEYFSIRYGGRMIFIDSSLKDEENIREEDISWYKVNDRDNLDNKELVANSGFGYSATDGSLIASEVVDAILKQKDDSIHIDVYFLGV